MKIEQKKLITFLTQLRMGEIDTCLFQFGEDGVKINTQSAAKSHGSYSFLKKEAFMEYSNIGDIGVDDLSGMITKVFKKFKKEINFTVEGNLFTVSAPDKSVKFELVDEKFVDAMKDMPTLDYKTTFKIPVSQMHSIIDETKGNENAIITFETVDGGVKVSNTGKYKFNYNIGSENTKGGVKCSYATALVFALSGILSKDAKDSKVDLTFHMITDGPVQIDYETEDYTIKFLIAPWVKGN